MAFLVPKKWKTTWSRSMAKTLGNEFGSSDLDENDFLNIESNNEVKKEVNTNDSEESKSEISHSKPYVNGPNKRSTKKDYQECPVCGTILLDHNAMAAMSHVDECLSNAVAKGDPSKKQRAPPSRVPPTTLQPNSFQSNPVPSNQQYQQYPPNPYSQPNMTTAGLQSSTPHSQWVPKPPHSESPFAVVCPYNRCGLKMEALDFFHHVLISHNTGNQYFSCPICTLANGIVYKARKGTNLYQHLLKQHNEFAHITPSFLSSKPPNQNTQTIEIISETSKIGTHYIVDTIREEDDVECTICFEEFHKGDYIARLDCFCIFHKHCLEQWFKKIRKCPLHKD